MCIRYILLCCYFSLAESALRWDQEPLNPTTAVEGNNVSLKWDYNLDGGTLDQVQWIQTESRLTIGRIIPPSSYSVKAKFRPRFTISETEEATLIITNVSRSDAGEIDCKVEDDVGEIISTIRLIVLYDPENTSFTVDHANTSAVILGTVVNFTCSAKASPPPHEFKLFNSDTEILNNSNGYFTLNVTQSRSYSCEAVNKVGREQSKEVNITVVVAPAITECPGSKEVRKGSNLTLFCDATGDPKPSLWWTRNSNPSVLPGGASYTEIQVQRPINSDDIIKFTCTASNGYGYPIYRTCNSTVTVTYEPEDIGCWTNPKVVEKGKQNITFYFSAESRPQECNVSLTQKQDDQVLVTTKLTCNGSSSSLHNVSTDDLKGGVHVFSCSPQNRVGKGVETLVNVTVQVPAEVIKASAIKNEVVEGFKVYLYCKVEGYPPPNMMWIAPNGTVVQNGASLNFTIHQNDTGTYRCNATNLLKSDSQTVTVNVFYKPENTQCRTINSTFQKGKDNVTFYFSAESRPVECNVSLVRNGSEQHVLVNGACSGSLTKLGTVSTDNLKGGVHTFTCSPKNRAGRGTEASVDVTITVPAKVISVYAKHTEVEEGSTAYLYCAVEGYPPPHVTWVAPNGDVIQNGTNANFMVNRNDTGTYRCNATNSLGSDSKSVELMVLYKPVETKCRTQSNSSTFEKGKDNVTFYFSAESRPQECNVSLFKDGIEEHVLINGACSGSLTKLHTVSTDNLKGGDHGFTCSAENRVGRGMEVSVSITITVPANVTSAYMNHTEVEEGSTA